MEIGAEPGTPKEPREGATLTMRLPMRGNIQVRVEELAPRRMTLVTLEGHPLSGAVRFRCEPRGDALRFEVLVHDRPSNIADWLMMSTVGGPLQRATWVSTVEQAVAESGGTAPAGVQHESETVSGDDAENIQDWLKEMVVERKREDRARESGVGSRESTTAGDESRI
jgi:NADH dehydrogenase